MIMGMGASTDSAAYEPVDTNRKTFDSVLTRLSSLESENAQLRKDINAANKKIQQAEDRAINAEFTARSAYTRSLFH